MLREIKQLAMEMGLSEGSVLKLARDISQDGALLSLAHMRANDLDMLLDFLQRAHACETRESKRMLILV